MRHPIAFVVVALLVLSASGTGTAQPPRSASGVVRLIYAAPTDREFRADYSAGAAHAAADFRDWLRRELGGWTFRLHQATPEFCQMPNDTAHYAREPWGKVLDDVQHCAPVGYSSPSFVWLIYADVVSECDTPGRLGAGGGGLAIFPRQDLEGLSGTYTITDDCGRRWSARLSRWIGGLGHELGHALGLPHPPGCDAGLPTCDRDALMWSGYALYPNTYLRDEEKAELLESPFIGFEGGVVPALPPVGLVVLAVALLGVARLASGTKLW